MPLILAWRRKARVLRECLAMGGSKDDAGPPTRGRECRWTRSAGAFLAGVDPASDVGLRCPSKPLRWTEHLHLFPVAARTPLALSHSAQDLSGGGAVSERRLRAPGLRMQPRRRVYASEVRGALVWRHAVSVRRAPVVAGRDPVLPFPHAVTFRLCRRVDATCEVCGAEVTGLPEKLRARIEQARKANPALRDPRGPRPRPMEDPGLLLPFLCWIWRMLVFVSTPLRIPASAHDNPGVRRVPEEILVLPVTTSSYGTTIHGC